MTHLAQIASYADNHLYVEKVTGDSNTYTKVTQLDENRRIMEIARIIGGDVVTETTVMSAKEMLQFSKKNEENEI